MRKAVMAVVLFAAVPLFAQEQRFRLSVFASDVELAYSEGGGNHSHADLGAALEYRWNDRWSLELSLMREEHVITATSLDPAGVTITRDDVASYPVDVMGYYQIHNGTRWKPYLGAGLRYENRVKSIFGEFGDTLSAQLGGGVHVMITPKFSVRADAKYAIPDSEFGSDIKPSIGFGWRF